MARQQSRGPVTSGVGRPSSCGRSFLPKQAGRSTVPAPALALALMLAAVPVPVPAGVSAVSLPNGVPGMSEPHTGSLLVQYYESFLSDQDIDRYRDLVSTRYTEGTLCRLVEIGHTQARRAAVLALGLSGSFQSNASVARALRDSDLTVRRLAGDALWSIWFRADSPENNKALQEVSQLIGRRRPEEAIEMATRLIARAPRFAEAYNQRATAHYLLGNYADSIDDCRAVLALNPYHFGALSGMASCQMQLQLRRDALKTLRRALKLQPHSESLRQSVIALEAEGE